MRGSTGSEGAGPLKRASRTRGSALFRVPLYEAPPSPIFFQRPLDGDWAGEPEAKVLRLGRTAGLDPAGALPRVDPRKEVIPCLVPVANPA